jgi:HEAT repeat protein
MLLEAALRDLEHRDPRVRAQAADALGRCEDGERRTAEPALLRACEDSHASVRYAALLSLGELAAAAAVGTLAAHLADVEPLCREAAAIALGQLGAAGGDAAWTALAAALTAAEPEVRFQAIASLAEIDAARAAPLVLPLCTDADAKVRAQAAAALGDAGDDGDGRHRAALAQLLDDVREVRHEAALALARLGDRRALPALTAALDDRDRAYDAAAALAALGIGDDRAARAALGALVGRFFGDPLLKVRAAEALARGGDSAGLEHLRRAARSRRDDVRGLAQSVLSELGYGTD